MQTPPVTNVTTGKICVSAIALILALTSLAEAAGFNVNSDVTLIPVASSYATSSNTAGCPAGFVGKFSFTAVLTNKPGAAMPGVTVRVVTLTNGNVLLNPETMAVLGGQGAEMTVPKTGQYADGLLSPGESVDVPFVMCLKTSQTFQFFVDVYGVVTKLVSVNLAGTDSGNNLSLRETLSPDGRFVGFVSAASDLIANDSNRQGDVFVRDLQTGTTTLVSVNMSGTGGGNAYSDNPSFCGDSRFVLFNSAATNLTPYDNQGQAQVYLRDLKAGTTTLVSINRFGTAGGDGATESTDFSADCRFVLFFGFPSDLVAADNIGGPNVFVRDLQNGRTTLVSVNRFGTGGGNGRSAYGTLSANGRFAVFVSDASDLVANDANGTSDVFVRDLQTGTTTLVSVNRTGTGAGSGRSLAYGRVISDDGRYVVFGSTASDLVANDTNGAGDVFVRDLQTGTTSLVSVNPSGTDSGNGDSPGNGLSPQISGNGRIVVFSSNANNLVANDNNGRTDLFIRDLQAGTTSLVSVNRTGTGSGNGDTIYTHDISADGRIVAFESNASDLVANDTNGTTDVFVRNLQTRTTSLVTMSRTGTAAGGGGGRLSADGRFVTFESNASDLVAPDTNGTTDVFVRPVP